MKLKNLLIAFGLAYGLAASAQFNPLRVSTGLNANLTDSLTKGSSDLRWKVSRTGINGTYLTPKRTNYGWPVASTNKGAWITYPDTCNSAEPAAHGCTTQFDTATYHYKISINLPDSVCGKSVTDSGAYFLGIKLWADNCVYKVYLNGNQVYSTTHSNTWGSSDHSGPGIPLKLYKYWQATTNVLIVEVRSEATSAGAPHGGWTGFLVVGDPLNSTDSLHPCDPPGGDDGGTGDCCLGNSCGKHANPLSSNYEIPLAGNHFLFSGDGTPAGGGSVGKVGVGYDCKDYLPAKLNAQTQKQTDPGADAGGNYAESIAIYGLSTYSGDNHTAVGVHGEARNMESRSQSIGVWGDALGAHDNIGGRFYAEGGQSYNIGVSAIAFPSTGNPAPHAYTLPQYYPSGANIGIYAAGELMNGDIGSPGMDWAGWFDGDVMINGNGYYANMAPIMSDRRFKREIQPLNDAVDLIEALKPSSYMLNTKNEYGLHFSDKKQYGFISQEVEQVLPDLVHTVKKPQVKDGDGKVVASEIEYKALNYIGFIALLTKGMQEQQAMLEKQAAVINELKAAVKALGGLPADERAEPKTAVIELSDKNTIVLNQNVPNPFAESTVISYNIPENFGKAQLVFTSEDGSVIKTLEILHGGKGNITVFANDLSNGIYSYSLIIDGRTIETKKMIKQ